MIDTRQSWEISYCIRVNFARTYLKYLTVGGRGRAMLQMAYHTEDIQEWAKRRIAKVLERAEDGRGGRQLSATAQAVVCDSVVGLVGAGLL